MSCFQIFNGQLDNINAKRNCAGKILNRKIFDSRYFYPANFCFCQRPSNCHRLEHSYANFCSPPGSSVHGILQARILEWAAISLSRGTSRPRNWTQVSHTEGRCFTNWAMWEAHTNFYLSDKLLKPFLKLDLPLTFE